MAPLYVYRIPRPHLISRACTVLLELFTAPFSLCACQSESSLSFVDHTARYSLRDLATKACPPSLQSPSYSRKPSLADDFIMGFSKRATANILSAFITLGIFILLWQTIGFQGRTAHVPAYHPVSKMHVRGGHFATRRIKPQTLPKAKILHPLLGGGTHLTIQMPQSQRYQYASPKLQLSAEVPFLPAPVTSETPSSPPASQPEVVSVPAEAQTQPESVTQAEQDVSMDANVAEQPQVVPETSQGTEQAVSG